MNLLSFFSCSCRHIRYLLCYLKVPFGEWGEYIYNKEKQRGVPPRVPLPPGILVPRLHGLPMQRVRPCPTAELKRYYGSGNSLRSSEQRVCVEVGYLSLMYPITVRSNWSGHLCRIFVCIILCKCSDRLLVSDGISLQCGAASRPFGSTPGPPNRSARRRNTVAHYSEPSCPVAHRNNSVPIFAPYKWLHCPLHLTM